MARWAGGQGGGAGKQPDFFDAIDLTLSSSPEPEERPIKTPQRQKQFSAQIKTEPHLQFQARNDSRANHRRPTPSYVKSEPHSRANQGDIVKTERLQPNITGRQTGRDDRSINPQHIAMMIDTCPHDAMREVLVNLCQMSPALSAAIARGLAPHSTYARNLIKQHRPISPASSVGTLEDDRDEGLASYNRIKQNLASKTATQNSKSPMKLTQASISTPRPQVKSEKHIEEPDFDLDMELNLPPSSARQVKKSYTPGPTTAKQSVTPLFQRSSEVISLSGRSSKKPLCLKCHDTIEDEEETCFYHPGAKTLADGSRVCSECEGPISGLGCSLGLHVRG